MGSDIRDRRLRLMQARQAEELRARFTSFEVFSYVPWADLPGSVPEELSRTRRTDATPDAVLPESADDDAIREWMASFFAAARIGDRFFLLTGIEHFPWLDLAARDGGWLDTLIDVKGYGLTILSHTKDMLLVFYEEEYEYQAFQVVLSG
jgi:hypothetical protein